MVVDYCTWRRLEGVRLWSINESECCLVIGSRDFVCLICGVDVGWLLDEFNELMFCVVVLISLWIWYV